MTTISFSPGSIQDLTVDERSHDRAEAVAAQLPSDLRVIVAALPQLRHRLIEMFCSTRCDQWLARAGGMSTEDARSVIREFPVVVSPKLNRNAANPRMFLAVAAVLAREPDVIVYDTAGMDPHGIQALASYLQSRLGRAAAIHVSSGVQ